VTIVFAVVRAERPRPVRQYRAQLGLGLPVQPTQPLHVSEAVPRVEQVPVLGMQVTALVLHDAA
jgi:hypothetical protein